MLENDSKNKDSSALSVLENKKEAFDVVKKSDDEIANQLIDLKTKDDYDKLVELFNVNQGKKSILQTMKWNDVLDAAGDEIARRLLSNPNNIDNDTLLKYMQTLFSQIKQTREYVNSIPQQQNITIKQENKEINININAVESNDRVKNAVRDILDQINKKTVLTDMKKPDEAEVIEADVVSDETKTEEDSK